MEQNFITEKLVILLWMKLKKQLEKMFYKNPPDAVFVANDHMAFAVMDTLRFELGFRIPEDVSVVGYDDVPAASWPSFNLTTVQQPVDTMVQKTVDILLKKIEHEGNQTAENYCRWSSYN